MLFDFCSILNLKRHVSNIVFIRLIEISMIIEKLFLEKKMIGNLVDKNESCLKELKEKKKKASTKKIMRGKTTIL